MGPFTPTPFGTSSHTLSFFLNFEVPPFFSLLTHSPSPRPFLPQWQYSNRNKRGRGLTQEELRALMLQEVAPAPLASLADTVAVASAVGLSPPAPTHG
jgi:alpha-D-ribose 1-methylphosphonate 5-triphosphate diphosphatase PhnM